jgi:membrane protease YdiL (CAAX protease family)
MNNKIKSVFFLLCAFCYYAFLVKYLLTLLPQHFFSLHFLAPYVESQFLNSGIKRFEIFLLTLSIFWLWIHWVDRSTKNFLCIKKGSIQSYTIGFLLVAGVLLVSYYLNITVGLLSVNKFIASPTRFLIDVIFVFVFSTFTSFSEELVFRGYIFEKLRMLTTPQLANIIQALLFGLIHYPNHPGVMIVLLTAIAGMIFGYAYLIFGNIYVSIGMHTAIHLINLLYSQHLWLIHDNASLQAKPIFHLFSADFGLFGFIGLLFLLIGLTFYYVSKVKLQSCRARGL